VFWLNGLFFRLMLWWPFRFVYAVYAFLVFVALMIPVFIWSVLVLPFGRIRGGNLIYRGCQAWATVWLFLVFIRHKNIYETPHDGNRSFIYVSNHISYLDAALIPRIWNHPVRPLGKVELSKLPLFGFIYKRVIVTVDRSSASNRANSVRLLKSILQKGISVLVFPEGTFNTTGRPLKEFFDGAFRVAIETGTPVKPVLILNAYDRLNYRSLFSFNPGKSLAIFLREFPTEQYELKDLALLKQEVYDEMEKKLVQYNASWIESDPVDKVDQVEKVDKESIEP
jgi:1-acyl-sn-glycerol-3-phosphate acyltransferase